MWHKPLCYQIYIQRAQFQGSDNQVNISYFCVSKNFPPFLWEQHPGFSCEHQLSSTLIRCGLGEASTLISASPQQGAGTEPIADSVGGLPISL